VPPRLRFGRLGDALPVLRAGTDPRRGTAGGSLTVSLSLGWSYRAPAATEPGVGTATERGAGFGHNAAGSEPWVPVADRSAAWGRAGVPTAGAGDGSGHPDRAGERIEQCQEIAR
jgi:hypothetical protein